MDRPEAKGFVGSVLAIAIEPTYFDLERYSIDPKEVVAMARRCHANALRVGMFSHQGHAYYQSALAPHAPGLGDRDLLREFQEACREAGAALVVYMNSKYDTQRYFEHPEWAMGHDYAAELKIYPMCPNSPYLDYFQSLLREVAGQYGPQTIYIDNFGLGADCTCQSCAEAFREACGEEPPARDWDDPIWQRYRLWSRERNFVLARRLVEAIRSARPDTFVVFNRGHFRTMTGHGNPEDIYKFAHEIADNVHGESAVRFYGQSFDHINEQCLFGRAIDTPMWTWVEYPVLPWSHVSAPPAEVKIKAAKVLANGGRPMVWTVPRAPDCDGRGLAGLADVFGLVERFPEYFNQTEHVPFLGVLYSSQTMEEYCRGEGDRFAECQKEFSGALTLARHNHLPAEVLLDRHVTQEYLSRYRVLVLPNAAGLSDEQCAEIRAFVQGGGGLVAAFESSLWDERGRRRNDFELADVFGASFVRDLGPQNEHWSTGYSVVDCEHAVTASVGTGLRLPAGGRYVAAKESGALRLCTLLTRCRYYCDHPGERTDFPGLLAHEFGKGRVVYVPGQFCLTYAERGFPDYRSLFRDAIDWVTDGEPLIRASLPDTVEVTLARSAGGAYVLHLVNCSADLSRPVERVVPVAGASVELRLPDPRRARALVAGVELRCELCPATVKVALPTLSEYEAVVMEH